MRLVLLHALPFDSRMWDSNLDEIVEDLVTPSLYTLGNSIEEWAVAVLDQCGNDELILVGSSVGGSCAIEMARASPDQVRGMILVGAKAGVRPDPVMRDAAVRVLECEGLEAGWLTYWQPLFGRNTDHAVVQSAHNIAVNQNVSDVVQGVRAFHNRRDHTQFVSNWTRPLFVISGDQDRTPTPWEAAASARGLHREFRLIDCGHYVTLEQPDRFRTILTRAVQLIRVRPR
jgi:pimeloyl-ACP methyl ester carboxylesterase